MAKMTGSSLNSILMFAAASPSFLDTGKASAGPTSEDDNLELYGMLQLR